MLQQAGLNKTIFLHFFDIHFLEYKTKGIDVLHIPIYEEARLATRFAFLMADELLVPAASYFESEICSKILSEFYHEYSFNGISLVANALNFEEFKCRKLSQYSKQSIQYKTYNNFKSGMCPPLYPRTHSSTKDIITSWRQCLFDGLVIPTITRQQDFIVPRDIEKSWEKVPEMLNEKAFIVQYVAPLLFKKQSHPTLINSLHGVIDKYYFLSYVDEFSTGLVRDLEYLASGYEIPSNGFCFSFKRLHRISRANGLLRKIWSCDISQLIELKNDPEWIKLSRLAFPQEPNVIGLRKKNATVYKTQGISIPDAVKIFVSFVDGCPGESEDIEKIGARWRADINRKKRFKPMGKGKQRADLYDIEKLAEFIIKKESEYIQDSSFDNFISALMKKAQEIQHNA